MRLPISGRVAGVTLRGGFRSNAAMVSEAGTFLTGGGLVHNFHKRKQSDSLCRTYCG